MRTPHLRKRCGAVSGVRQRRATSRVTGWPAPEALICSFIRASLSGGCPISGSRRFVFTADLTPVPVALDDPCLGDELPVTRDRACDPVEVRRLERLDLAQHVPVVPAE